MEAVPTTLAVPDVRRGRKVQLGRAVFALTSTALLVAAALDIDARTYDIALPRTEPRDRADRVLRPVGHGVRSPGFWRSWRSGE